MIGDGGLAMLLECVMLVAVLILLRSCWLHWLDGIEWRWMDSGVIWKTCLERWALLAVTKLQLN